MSEVLLGDRDSIEQAAADKGLICFFPEDDEILIDWDNPAPFSLGRVGECLTDNGWEIGKMLETISLNGNRHYYIAMGHGLTLVERIMVQACLGSDPVREILSYLRWNDQSETPTALFETPEMAERVNHWRSELKYT